MRSISLGFAITIAILSWSLHAYGDPSSEAKFCARYEDRRVSTIAPLTTAENACLAICADPAARLGTELAACKADPNYGAKGDAVAGTLGTLDWVPIVTDFFVARLKAELLLYLQSEISGELCASDSKVATAELLKNTCPILTSEDGSIGSLPAALKRDFDALPSTLPTFALGLAGNLGSQSADARDVICVALVTPGAYRALRSGGPLAALKDLAVATRPEPECQVILKSVNEGAAWLASQLGQVALDGNEAPKVIAAISGTTKTLVLNAAIAASVTPPAGSGVATTVTRLQGRIGELAPLLAELVELVRQYKAGDHSTDVVDQMADRTMRILALSTNASDAATADLLALGASVADFSTGRYGPGLTSLLSIKTIDTWMSNHATTKKLWSAFGTWGNLLAGLAAAKTADDAQRLLDNAAAPLGSYREFRSGKWTGFISGYGGVTFGLDHPFTGSSGVTLAPFLPIGLEVGHRLDKSQFTFNALVSVIDVGALAATRLSGSTAQGDMGMTDQIQAKPEQSFRSVFAPGVFLALGLGKSPFVVGAGGELLPSNVLRFECSGGGPCSSTVTTPTIRAMLFLAVDITAFHVF